MGKQPLVLRSPLCLWRVTRRRAISVARWAVLAAGVLHAATLQAYDSQAFMLFPVVTGIHRSDSFEPLDVDRNELDAGFSAFLARDFGPLRVLGEVFVTTDEQEIERAQLGWKFAGESIAWLGRFHNPLGFWNTYYHHGAYMQTSVSRPGIFEYEDQDGPLPSHLTGVLIEGTIEQGPSGWYYQLAAGAAPQLGERLEPLNILRPADGSHKLGTTLRLSFRPDADGSNETGVYLGHTRIAGADDSPMDVTQRVAGGFAFWQWSETWLRAEALSVASDFDAPLAARGSFVNGYAQLEQRWHGDWTLYGRVEGTRGGHGDAYLSRFARFVTQRDLLGLRYELTRRQALKLEISRVHLQAAEYSQLDLQWAAVFP